MVVLCRSRLELQQHAISTKVGRKLKMLMKQHFRNGITALISTIRTNLLHHAGIWHDAWLTSSRLGKSVRPGLSRNVLRVSSIPSFHVTAKVSVNARDCCSSSAK